MHASVFKALIVMILGQKNSMRIMIVIPTLMHSKTLVHSNPPQKFLLQYLKPESNGVKSSFRSWKKSLIMLIFVIGQLMIII